MFTYGNWGGKKWNGGIYTNKPDWKVKATDRLDFVFYLHKQALANGVDRRNADCRLVNVLIDTHAPSLYGKLFKYTCIVYYALRVFFLY